MRVVAAALRAVALILAYSHVVYAFMIVPETLRNGKNALTTLTFHPTAGWQPRSSTVPQSTSLYAKAAKRKKKKKSSAPASSSGGFGKAAPAAVAKKEDDDYAAFPTLEPNVQETILAFEGETKEQGEELPNDIYQRLDQIYGFHNFNYLEEEEEESTSLGDLLAAAPPKDEPISEMSDLLKPAAPADLSDLFTAQASDSETSDVSTDLPCLSSLPPFTDFHVLHMDPLVISIDNFFTDEECDRYVAMSQAPSKSSSAPEMTRSKTVGKDANAKAQRTSTTWFHHFEQVPELVSKASRLLGLDGINHWEEPQTVRYRRNEKFTWHLDALAPSDDLESLGGQRTATLLVYLTELLDSDGGATVFRDLKDNDGKMLRVRPKKGSALLFFPAAGGIPDVPFDIRTLHCGEVVSEETSQDKWIAQLWLRKGTYAPTAPKGNTHEAASDAIADYCTTTAT